MVRQPIDTQEKEMLLLLLLQLTKSNVLFFVCLIVVQKTIKRKLFPRETKMNWIISNVTHFRIDSNELNERKEKKEQPYNDWYENILQMRE